MDVVAEVEVKVNIQSSLKTELTEIEHQQWENDEGLSPIPKSEIGKNKYDAIISDLNKIRILRKQLVS